MRPIRKFIKSNIFFLVLVSAAVILITQAPIIYGYFINNQDHYFTGLNTIATIDGNVYLSYLEQVKAGHFLFRDLFNSNDDFRVLNPFWLLAGLAAKILNLSAPLALQLFRILTIPIFLFALFKIVSLLCQGTGLQKKLCYLFSLIISGFGSFIFPVILISSANPDLDSVPIDLWAYETSNFMILRYYPHVILAISLIFLIFYYFYQAIEKKSYQLAAIAGVLALFLFSFHPFQVPLIYAVLLAYIVVLFIAKRKVNFKDLKIYGLFFLISLPSVLYYVYQLFFNNNIFLKAVQNNCWATSPFLFIISFGLGLFLALYYIYYLWQQKKISQPQIFSIVWFAATIFLVYCPFLNFQRRMLGGFIVPVAILAFSTLVLIYKKLAKLPGLRIFLLITLCFFVSFSNLFVYNQDFKFFYEAIHNGFDNTEMEYVDNLVYVDKEIKEALDWYKQNAKESDIILSSYERGNSIPGLTGQKVYFGHPIETVGFKAKKADVKNFFLYNFGDEAKKEFLKQNKITYMFYSDFEKKLGIFNPEDKDYLQEAFKNNKAIIYKVNSD